MLAQVFANFSGQECMGNPPKKRKKKKKIPMKKINSAVMLIEFVPQKMEPIFFKESH